MNNLNIRLIESQDLEILAEIYCRVYRAFDVGEQWEKEAAYKMLRFWYERQPDLFFVAEFSSKIVGAFVAEVKPWNDGNHLIDGEIFVDPDYQKKGIGSELIKKMCRVAIDKYNVKYFDTITFSKPKHPLSWYKKIGFREHKDWVNITADLEEILENLKK